MQDAEIIHHMMRYFKKYRDRHRLSNEKINYLSLIIKFKIYLFTLLCKLVNALVKQQKNSN